jgi:hypothetical protein
MTARHPSLAVQVVEDQGHAPLLTDTATVSAIGSFIRRCDATA